MLHEFIRSLIASSRAHPQDAVDLRRDGPPLFSLLYIDIDVTAHPHRSIFPSPQTSCLYERRISINTHVHLFELVVGNVRTLHSISQKLLLVENGAIRFDADKVVSQMLAIPVNICVHESLDV